MTEQVAMDIEDFYATLSEEEKKELTDSINQELAELYEKQRLELEAANYWLVFYCVVATLWGGILAYFGYKLYTWRSRKLRREKLQRKIEKKKTS